MANNTVDLYLLRTLSNLHVGKGDSNYGIVDNEVQRDPVENLPVIFSSSLKGALREFMDRKLGIGHSDTIEVFGNVVNQPKQLQRGTYVFHEARLHTIPVRSGNYPYYNGTTMDILSDLANLLSILMPGKTEIAKALDDLKDIEVEGASPRTEKGPAEIDEYRSIGFSDLQGKKVAEIRKSGLLGDRIALFNTKDFKDVCDRLPVIARNQLDNGVSNNLFYEEVVPRLSTFTLFIERPDNNDKLYEYLEQDNFRVQIGANASIGYGVCELIRIQKNI